LGNHTDLALNVDELSENPRTHLPSLTHTYTHAPSGNKSRCRSYGSNPGWVSCTPAALPSSYTLVLCKPVLIDCFGVDVD